MPYLKRPLKRVRKPTPYKRAAMKYYAHPGWRRLRAETLSRLPWCVMCLCRSPLRMVTAQEVHHLHPIQSGGTDDARTALALDPDNVCPLCRRCHSELHSKGISEEIDMDFFSTMLQALHQGCGSHELGVMIANRRLKLKKQE